MSVKGVCCAHFKPEKTIFAVIGGKSSVTSDMAVAFESVTKIPAHFWLNIQRGYDEYVARQKREEQLALAYEWACSFPLAKMMELGWIPMVKTVEEKVKALLSFFQVSTERAWEDYYLNQQLKVAFRISLNNTKEPHAISAWLRQGEVQAAETEVCEFSEKALREAIPAMKSLCAEHPADFAVALQELCAKVGVKLVYTPCLPKAPINGSTRWINDAPCIQMTGRHKEKRHILVHILPRIGTHPATWQRKTYSWKTLNMRTKQKEKEEEADAFSSRTLLSQAEENEIIRQGDFSADTIRYYAEKFNVHPAIIVGRLQHKKVIPFTAHSTLIEKIELFN